MSAKHRQLNFVVGHGLGRGTIGHEAVVSRPHGPPRVLIVDDLADAAGSLAKVVELTGMDAFVAHDGFEAVELAQRLRPDLIFMDFSMPGLNGADAIARIRDALWGRTTPICALVARGDWRTLETLRSVGCDHCLIKPAAMAEIDSILALLPRSHQLMTS